MNLPAFDAGIDRAVGEFLRLEARLLDEARYDEWNRLFTDDGIYWLPVSSSATDPRLEASHLHDDGTLRAVRIARLQSGHAHSQQPPGRAHHLLQTPDILELSAARNRLRTRTVFLYHELRAGRTIALPGVAWHTLVREADDWRIALKRVDLMHATEPIPAVEFYI